MKFKMLALSLLFATSFAFATDTFHGQSTTNQSDILQKDTIKAIKSVFKCDEVTITSRILSIPEKYKGNEKGILIEADSPIRELWAIEGCKAEKLFLIELLPDGKGGTNIFASPVLPNDIQDKSENFI